MSTKTDTKFTRVSVIKHLTFLKISIIKLHIILSKA